MKTFFLAIKLILLGLLATWCVMYGYGFWEVTNWFDLLGAYLVELLPAALLLIWVSILLRRDAHPWAKHVAEIGLSIAALAVVLPALMIFWDVYTYYVDLKHPFTQFEFRVPNPFEFLPLPPGWY